MIEHRQDNNKKKLRNIKKLIISKFLNCNVSIIGVVINT
jgi:hypothetical protein